MQNTGLTIGRQKYYCRPETYFSHSEAQDMDKQQTGKTVRLLMPQWQGGNMGASYPMGAKLLAWLAPESDATQLEVPVERFADTPPPLEDGIVGRTAIMKQLRAARNLLDAYDPDRVITFGGDCLVSQAPFAWLNERYDGRLGVLWIDAHPDVTTPKDFRHAHAMVLGNLLGEGDPGLTAEVRRPLDPKLVMFAGVDDMLDYEWEVANRLALRRASSSDLAADSNPVLQWVRDNNIKHVAIHLDLDVLDPRCFRSQMFNMPTGEKINAFSGKMTLDQITRLVTDVAAQTSVVGFTFAEHMPWDDINLMNMMDAFPFMK